MNLDRELAELRNTDEYRMESAISDFTAEVRALMESQGVSRKELADRLHVSQPYVSKLLRGDNNFTIRNMARVAGALGRYVRIHLAPESVLVTWQELTPAEARGANQVRAEDRSTATQTIKFPARRQAGGLRVLHGQTHGTGGHQGQVLTA